NWTEPEPYARICLDPDNDVFCLIDWEDYEWALQWLWSPIRSRSTWKLYATRSTRLNGRGGGSTRIYLHKEVLLRAEGAPPTPKHNIGDHKNGNSLDNRRANLRWATSGMNARNRYGYCALQGEMQL